MPYNRYHSDSETEAPEVRYRRQFNKEKFVVSGINGKIEGCNCNNCENNRYNFINSYSECNTGKYNPLYYHNDFAMSMRHSDFDNVMNSDTHGGNTDNMMNHRDMFLDNLPDFNKYSYNKEFRPFLLYPNVSDDTFNQKKIINTFTLIIFIQFLVFLVIIYYFGIFMKNYIFKSNTNNV